MIAPPPEHSPGGAVDPFETLFLAEHARLVAVAVRITGDPDAAHDIAQEVFCSFFRRHSADVPFAAAWLHAGAVHAALNHMRGERRRARRERAHALGLGSAQPGRQQALNPQEVLERNETRRQVRTVLARLPRRSAAVLALRYSGLSYSEVAAALDVRVGQVGTLLRRAEIRFCKEIKDEAGN